MTMAASSRHALIRTTPSDGDATEIVHRAMLPSAPPRSFEERMITKSGCHLKFKPRDCIPTETKPGTMADVFFHILFPSVQSTPPNKIMHHETVTFDDIPVVPYRHHSGTFIPTVSLKLKLLVKKVTDLLMPNA